MDENEEGVDAEDLVALQALIESLEIEGDGELAEAQREVLALMAQKEQRRARGRREAAIRAEQRREALERAARQVERLEGARRAHLARDRAVEKARRLETERLVLCRAQQAALARARAEAERQERTRRAQELRVQRAPSLSRPARKGDEHIPVHPREHPKQQPPAQVSFESIVETTGVAPVSGPSAGVPKGDTGASTPGNPAHLPPLTGADLASWRARLGLTQQAAADRLGVRQGTVSKAESRLRALLGPTLCQALARENGVGRPA